MIANLVDRLLGIFVDYFTRHFTWQQAVTIFAGIYLVSYIIRFIPRAFGEWIIHCGKKIIDRLFEKKAETKTVNSHGERTQTIPFQGASTLNDAVAIGETVEPDPGVPGTDGNIIVEPLRPAAPNDESPAIDGE